MNETTGDEDSKMAVPRTVKLQLNVAADRPPPEAGCVKVTRRQSRHLVKIALFGLAVSPARRVNLRRRDDNLRFTDPSDSNKQAR